MKQKLKPLLIFSGLTLALMLSAALIHNYQHLRNKRLPGFNTFLMQAYQELATFYDAGVVLVNSLVMAVQSTEPPKQSALRSIHIRVEKGSLENILSNIPTPASNVPKYAKKRYFNAWLKYPDDKWRRIKYRMRGRSIWHYDIEKPSFRLKLRKSNPINFLRHINLVSPEDRPMLANIVADDLARSMGVMAHVSEMVRLFINGRFAGVYQLQTREDEEMIRLNGRIPGPIYDAKYLKETWAKEDFEIIAEDKWLKELQVEPMQAMTDAIYMEPSPEKYDHLWSSIDFDKFANWHAVITLAGGLHSNWYHNQTFYFDPSRGLLEPIINDVNGHGMVTYPTTWRRILKPFKPDFHSPINELNFPLLDVALRDPRFHHARNKALYKALTGVGSLQSQTKLMQSYFKAMDPDVYADRHKGAIQATFGGLMRVPYSNGQYEESKLHMSEWINNRNGFLMDLLEKTSVRAVISRQPRNNQTFFVLEVDGDAAVTFNPSAFGKALWADRTLVGAPRDKVEKVELLHPGFKKDTNFYDNYYFFFFKRVPNHFLASGVQRYLFAADTDHESVAKALKGAFSNSLSGNRVKAEIAWSDDPAPLEVAYNSVSIHPWLFPEPATNTVAIGPGQVTLTHDLLVGPQQRLEVEPGTELRLGAGVSIISRGEIHMAGTADKPIVIRRLHDDQAWGAIVIQGEMAKNSRIEFARISGGSLEKAGNIPYSGMVNVHWADGFRLENSTLEANDLSDDTLHIVHSVFSISQTTLNNCFGDCIDLDYAKGTIENLQISNAGNDGVDFMTSDAKIRNASVIGSKDKGFSVGEMSNVTATEGVIRETAIGIAVKDRSTLSLNDWTLDSNDIGIDVYKKNWRYGGPGKADLTEIRFNANRLDIRAAKNGEVKLRGMGLPPVTEGEGSIRTIVEPRT